MKKLTAKFLNHTCRVYTITAVLLVMMSDLFLYSQNAANSNNAYWGVSLETFWMIIPFSVFFALANLLYGYKKIVAFLRVLLHCVIVTLAAFTLLYLPQHTQATNSNKLTIFLVMLVLYWICMLPYLIVVSIVKRKKNATTEYQSAFKKNGK